MTEAVHIRIEPETLTHALRRNFNVLMAQIDGITHEESLIQPPFFGNCFNWVLGHLLQSRNKMLTILGDRPIWTAEQIARYDRDSAPITADGDDIFRFEQLVADLESTQTTLMNRISAMNSDDLEVLAKKIYPTVPDWSIGESLQFMLWHETYHAGQTELLRQLAGKHDKVI